MNYYQRIQKTIDYFEANMEEPIQILDLAEMAGFSLTHFYRIFNAMTGMSVKTYMRNRRLSTAAQRLKHSEESILDIALDFQFSSSEAFSRAFSKVYGITPGKYRREANEIALCEKVNVLVLHHLKQIGGATMEVKVVEKMAMNVVGVEGIVKPGDASIPKLWQKFDHHLPEINHAVKNGKSYGLSTYIEDIQEDDAFMYLACIEIDQLEEIPVGMIAKTIPQGKYAVFTCEVTPEEIKNTYQYIYSEWMPKSGYEPGETDTLEAYSGQQMEIYIPLRG